MEFTSRLVVREGGRATTIAFRMKNGELWIAMRSTPGVVKCIESDDFKPVRYEVAQDETGSRTYSGALTLITGLGLTKEYYDHPYAFTTKKSDIGNMYDSFLAMMLVSPRSGVITYDYDAGEISAEKSQLSFPIPDTIREMSDFNPGNIIDMLLPNPGGKPLTEEVVPKPAAKVTQKSQKMPSKQAPPSTSAAPSGNGPSGNQGPNGLFYFDNAVPKPFAQILQKWFRLPETEEALLPVKNAQGKSSENSRRVLQYGYAYNYQSGNTREKIEDMPHIIEVLRSVIPEVWTDAPDDILEKLNQCIINRYLPGQGIGAHIDGKRGNKIDYGDTVVCFTFLSGRAMKFNHGISTHEVYTRPLSMYVMTGDARYEWTHEMVGRKSDVVGGRNIPRSECFSVTFRQVM
jgi:alkylated DNA repair dioxygenase AlkB